jgi:hypothetical protein
VIRFGIKPDPKNKQAEDLLKSIARNAQRAANAVAYDAASRYKDDVEERLDEAGSRMRPILDKLMLKKYEQGFRDVYAVMSEVKKVSEEEALESMMAVWVVPKMMERWIFLLKQESPWPLDMLPVKPKPSEAELVGRRLRQDEMERLRSDKKARLENVLSQLGAYGIDTTIDTAEVEVEIVVDTAWEAIRAEFGLDGFRRVPIWQPALKEILRDRKHVIEVMEKALIEPTQAMHVEDEATSTEVAAIQKFQDKVKV